MYNQDHNLCRLCDEEPAIYSGLCAVCLSGDEHDPNSGKFTLRHAPRKRDKKNEEEE